MEYLTEVYNLQLQEILLVSLVSFLIAYYLRSNQTVTALKESVLLVKGYKEQQIKSNELNKLQNENFKLQDLNNALRNRQSKIKADIETLSIDKKELIALQKIRGELKNVNQEDKKQVSNTTKPVKQTPPVEKKEEAPVNEEGYFDLDEV